MKRLLIGLLFTTAFVTAASSNDDLNRYIAERAVNCWATPVAMRGVRFDATYEVSFTREGHVDLVQIVDFVPESDTSRALTLDFAEAVKSCGPYDTEGMRDITLYVIWPM